MVRRTQPNLEQSLELLHEVYTDCGGNAAQVVVVLMNAATLAGRIASVEPERMKRMVDELAPHADNTIRLLEVARDGLPQ